MHRPLRCSKRGRNGYTCGGDLGVYWGGYIVRTLERGERAREGHDAQVCGECGQKYEIGRRSAMRKAA